MIRKRILSLLVCAALLCGVLAGCSTSSGSTAASTETVFSVCFHSLRF